MKEIATSQYDFAVLRGGGCVYVDKTDILAKLALKKADAQYFIARPRRFGKSLMLSTLRYMFEGRRDLFRGLKIERTKWDWSKTYPVIMLNMSDACAETPEDVKSALCGIAEDIAARHGLEVRPARTPGMYFGNVLKALYEKKGRFVVLVDEYDVPLQGFLDDPRSIRRVRKIMHDFYVQLKNNVGAIRFLMITGVTKFTKLSIFSGLNNLTDLTIKYGDCAALLGYTHDELKDCFAEHIAALGKKLRLSPDETYKSILSWYDSYRFSPYSKTCVVNPVALGESFKAGILAAFWSATGMPTLVLERMQTAGSRPDQLQDIPADTEDLDVCDALTIPLVPLLYQSGYLTIKDVEWETLECGERIPHMKLGVPNKEILKTLGSQWWKSLMQMKEGDFTALVHVAEKQIAAGDIDGLVCKTLYQLYAKLPPTWTPKTEQDAKRYFLLFMEMAGAKMQAEEASARGFADAVVETKKGVWIFEFKFNRSAASAIRQIRERGYADAYASKVKVRGEGEQRNGSSPSNPTIQQSNNPTITLVGIKFDPKRRNIDMPRFEQL